MPRLQIAEGKYHDDGEAGRLKGTVVGRQSAVVSHWAVGQSALLGLGTIRAEGQRPRTNDALYLLSLRVQYRVDLAIDTGCIASCAVDGLGPLLVLAVQFGFLQKIGSLQD